MMKSVIRTRKQLPLFAFMESRIIFSVACIIAILRPKASSSLVANIPRRPTASPLTSAVVKTFSPSRLGVLPRLDKTRLKNRNERNNEGAGDDFASFGNFDRGVEDEGRRLAREFYQELQFRQGNNESLHESAQENGGDSGTGPNNTKDNPVRVRASTRRAFANQPTSSSLSSQVSSSLFSMFPFFSSAPRQATSAGLFSGTGTTVYSSGRSIRAEIELLETTLKNNDAGNNDSGRRRDWTYYAGTPEQLDDVLRLIALSLVVLSAAYVAVEASGGGAAAGMQLLTWEGAAASANRVVALVTDGVSGVVIGVGNGEVFVGEEAAWLMRESSDFAAIVLDAVRSVEQLVLI
jgi:hypothetical protein